MESSVVETKTGPVLLSIEITSEPIHARISSTGYLTIKLDGAVATDVVDNLDRDATSILLAAAKSSQLLDVCQVDRTGAVNAAYRIPITLDEQTPA